MFFSYPLHCLEFWCIPIIFGVNAIILQRSNLNRIIILLAIFFCCHCGIYNYYLPLKIKSSFNIALALHKKEEYALSNRILKDIEKQSPAVIVLYLMAQNYYNLSDPNLAKHYYYKCAARVPHKIYPHYKLMQIHLEEKDTINAIKEAKIIINRKPKIKSPATDEMKEAAVEFINKITTSAN